MSTTDGRRLVTLADVAKKAGFSRSTASLVFQESPLVADVTRQRVLAAAADIGYVYNRRAAALRMQHTKTVGLLIPGVSNPFLAQLVDAVEVGLAPSGNRVLLANSLDDPERQTDLIRTLLENRVDGLLIVPALGSATDFIRPIQMQDLPHVLMTRRVPGVDSAYVGLNDRRGGRIAAEHLLEHGSRTIAYFGGPEVYTAAERLEGVRDALGRQDAVLDQRWTIKTKTTSAAGYAAAEALLAASTAPPDAIICHSDAIAFGMMHSFMEHGIRIGVDTRIIGFDDVDYARLWSPPLSSIAVSAPDMGRSAASMLISQIASGSPASLGAHIFEPALIRRESCGCA